MESSAGNFVRKRHDWVWFCLSLVEKIERVLLLINQSTGVPIKVKANYFQHVIENHPNESRGNLFKIGVLCLAGQEAGKLVSKELPLKVLWCLAQCLLWQWIPAWTAGTTTCTLQGQRWPHPLCTTNLVAGQKLRKVLTFKIRKQVN